MDGSSSLSEANMENERISMPVTVIAGYTMVIERRFVAFMCLIVMVRGWGQMQHLLALWY
jgi:hypothetical protein